MSKGLSISEHLFSNEWNNGENLSDSNLRLSQSLQMLCSEATSGSAIVGMSMASLASVFMRTKSLSLCSRFLGESNFAKNFSHYFSIGTGLVTEGYSFHLAPEFLRNGTVSTLNLAAGGASSTLTVAFSKVAGRGPQGFLLQQLSQDLAMISAQEVSGYLGWSERVQGSFSERWVGARITACQMQAGAGLLRLSCHEVGLVEARLKLSEVSHESALRSKLSLVPSWVRQASNKIQELFLPQSANGADARIAFQRANEQVQEQTKKSQIMMMNNDVESLTEFGLTSVGGDAKGEVSQQEAVFEFDPNIEYRSPFQVPQIVPRRIADPRQTLVVLPMGGIGPYGHERSTYYKAIGDPRWMAEVGVINGHLRRIDMGRYADLATGEELSLSQVAERYGKQIEEKSGVQSLDSRIMRIVRDDLYMNPLTGEVASYPAEKLKEIATSRDLFVAVPYSHGVYRHPISGEELHIPSELIRTVKDEVKKPGSTNLAGENQSFIEKAKKGIFEFYGKEILLLTDIPFEYLPTGERVTRAKAEALLDAEFSSDADFETLAKLALETDWAGQIPPGLRGAEGETSDHLLNLLGISKRAITTFSFRSSGTYLTNADPVAALALYSLVRSARQYGFYLSEIGAEIGIHISSGIGGWQSVIHGAVSALKRKRGTKRIATVPNTETNNIAMILNDFIQGYLGVTLGMKGEDALPIRDNSIDVGACATGHKNFKRAADLVRSGNTKIGFFGGTEFVLGLPWCRPAITSFNAIKAMATREKLKGLDPNKAPKDWYAPLFTQEGFQIAEGAGVGAIMSLHDFMKIAPAQGFLVGGYDIRGDQGGKKNSADMGIGAIHAREASLIMMAEQLGFAPEVIQGIFLHGTGTQKLNTVELEQAAETYSQKVWVSALKGHIGGHLLGAAPSLEDAVVLQSLAYGFAPGVYTPPGGKLTATAQNLVDGGRILVGPGPHLYPQHVESVKNGFGGNNTNVNYHLLSDGVLIDRFGYTPRQVAEMRARQSERVDVAAYWERAMDVTGEETGGTFLNQFGLKERPPALPTFIDFGEGSTKNVEGAKPGILLALAARQRGEKVRYKNTSPELADLYEFVESGIDFRSEIDSSFSSELEGKVKNLKEEEKVKLATYLRGAFHLSSPESREVLLQAYKAVLPQISSKETRWELTKSIADQLVDRNFKLRMATEKTLLELAPALEQVDVASLAWKAVHVMKNSFPEVQETSSRIVQKLIPLLYPHERRGLVIELIRWHVESGNRTEGQAVLELLRPHLVDGEGALKSWEDFERFVKNIFDKSSSRTSYLSTAEQQFKELLNNPELILHNVLLEAVRKGSATSTDQGTKKLEAVPRIIEQQILACCDEGTHEQRAELAYKMQAIIDSPIALSPSSLVRGSSHFKYVVYSFTKLLLPRLLPANRFPIAISLGRWLLDQHYGNHRGHQYPITEHEMKIELEEVSVYLSVAEERREFNRQIETMITTNRERELKASTEV